MYKRIPRKLKKQLKKNLEEWEKFLQERKIARERSANLDIIFTRNYKHSHKIIQRVIRTGKI
jgi:hypothetical protein